MAVDLDSTIADLYAAGESVSQLARRFSLKPRDVVNILKRFNLYAQSSRAQGGGRENKPAHTQWRQPLGQRAMRRDRDESSPGSSSAASGKGLTVEQRILALYNQGISPDEIVRITGRRRHMVVFTLQKAGQFKPKRIEPEEGEAGELIPEPFLAEPVVERIPVVEPVVEPIVERIAVVEPIVERIPVVEPIGEELEEPEVAQIAELVAQQVVEQVVEPVKEGLNKRIAELPAATPAGSEQQHEEKPERWSPEIIGAIEKIAMGYYSQDRPEAEIKAMIDALNRNPRPKAKPGPRRHHT